MKALSHPLSLCVPATDAKDAATRPHRLAISPPGQRTFEARDKAARSRAWRLRIVKEAATGLSQLKGKLGAVGVGSAFLPAFLNGRVKDRLEAVVPAASGVVVKAVSWRECGDHMSRQTRDRAARG